MSIEFKLPELGENIESGDVVKVLVREGQAIEGNQAVVELETDKAVVEIPCRYAGTIAKIHVGEGDTVKVGQTLLTVEAEEGAAAAEEAPPAEAAAEPKPVETKPAEATPPPAPVPPEPAAAAGPAATPEPQPAPPADSSVIPAGPAARRVARELGVDIRRVQGSGTRGRITPEDVQAQAAAGPAAGSTEAAAPQPVTPAG